MPEPFNNLGELATELRVKLNDKKRLLIFAGNGVGKTRLSMEFKKIGKEKEEGEEEKRDTLYFNAFTEDLFTWVNDFNGDSTGFLKMNPASLFIESLGGRAIDAEDGIVQKYFSRYADFRFRVDADWKIIFYRPGKLDENNILQGEVNNMKISRGEQSMFIWCVFLYLVQLVLDEEEADEEKIKYIYIDDPVSSLDDGNVIATACDLAEVLKEGNRDDVKIIISTHHWLFFHVVSNLFKRADKYLVSKDKEKSEGVDNVPEKYYLTNMGNKPGLYHVAMLKELEQLKAEPEKLYTYHFNILRSIVEKTTIFFGWESISECIGDDEIGRLAINTFSHGNYPLYSPIEMDDSERDLFIEITTKFIDNHNFNLSEEA
ncbi:MAG: AAA family ATPase [Proteobacteria bacterium]|nr:AAA family ATPase [Pseudomonadota bacterium]